MAFVEDRLSPISHVEELGFEALAHRSRIKGDRNRSAVIKDDQVNTLSLLAYAHWEDQQVELAQGEHVWQWQRKKGGFRSYPEAQNRRIEEAYRRGHSKVRFKGSREGTAPMEIFFVDMMQLNPNSRNLRRVRRIGAKSCYIELERHVRAIARSVISGERRWESFEKYKERQHAILGIDTSGTSGNHTSVAGKPLRISSAMISATATMAMRPLLSSLSRISAVYLPKFKGSLKFPGSTFELCLRGPSSSQPQRSNTHGRTSDSEAVSKAFTMPSGAPSKPGIFARCSA